MDIELVMFHHLFKYTFKKREIDRHRLNIIIYYYSPDLCVALVTSEMIKIYIKLNGTFICGKTVSIIEH